MRSRAINCTLFFIFLSVSTLYGETIKKNLKIHSYSAILINGDTKQILYEKNAFEPLPPASITKVPALVYALKMSQGHFTSSVQADWDCVGSISKAHSLKMKYNYPPHRVVLGGTHLSIHHQEVLNLKDLMYGMMLVSANDAANMIAKHVGGSVQSFMSGLNKYLKSIGCKNTNLRNPHGYYYPKHKTTAYDMALVTYEGLKDPIFREIFKTHEYCLPSTNKQKAKKIKTFCRLLRPGHTYYYPFAIGAKTGYNDQSRNTLVAAAQKEGKTLILVLLKCPKSSQKYEDALLLFKEGFKALK